MGPVAGRLGSTPVLRTAAVAHPAGLVAFVFAADGGSTPLICAAAMFAGGTCPPLTVPAYATLQAGPDADGLAGVLLAG
ncbi:hypothetical protein [Actinoallomurus sp. CA-142502]|uniref:hypothetical protein n=1 Tax=Actinoallomurus sp. CA-142502 TaxID=3239885 RepID=UPI003D8B9486